MRVLVIGSAFPDTSPGSRFRIEQWMQLLEKQGVSFDYAAFEDQRLHQVLYTQGNRLAKATGMLRGIGRRLQLLRSLDRYDVVFIYEEAARMGPAFIERLIARTGTPIVFDFCDPIYKHIDSPSNGYWSYLKFPGKTRTNCRLAAHVLVGNEELARFARQHNPQVTVVPITIDTEEYRPKPWQPRPPGYVPVVGWTGSHSTVPHLDDLRPVLQRLASKQKFRLKVIGTKNGWQAEGVDVDAQPWRADSEVADLQTIDIGVMPLPDDPWVKLRTNLKIRQYMGLGIPCVASPIGVNKEVIQDGENGFLASTEAEWEEKLTRLIQDPGLRKRIGDAGRKTIEEKYSAAVWAPRILEILKQAAATRTARSAA